MTFYTAADVPSFNPRDTIDSLRKKGLHEEALHLEVLVTAWSRVLGAYHSALGVLDPEAVQKLHVVTYTIQKIWGPLIQGVELPDRESSIKEHAENEAWHRLGPEAWHRLD